MCGGKQFDLSGQGAYALAPVNGVANGRVGTEGASISLEDARISVAYCAEQMKNEPDCSPQFIGVVKNDGRCWCAQSSGTANTDCSTLETNNHFFERMLPACTVAHSNMLPGTACTCLPGFKGDITWNNRATTSTCTQTQCTGLDALTGVIVTKSRSDQHGSVATFTCEPGFMLTGAQNVSCSAPNDDSNWPVPDPTPCTPTQCTNSPTGPRDGFVHFNNSDKHQSVATFSCKPGFKLNGTDSIQCIAQSADKDWPTPDVTPTCAYDGSNSNLDTQGWYASMMTLF